MVGSIEERNARCFKDRPSVIKGEKRKKALRSLGALSANKVWALMKKGAKGEKNTNIYV